MPWPGACLTHSTLHPTSTTEEAATCPASFTTQTLAGAVNHPLGNLPRPKCLTEAGCPHKGGPTHGRREAGKGQGHCTSDSHINSMLLRSALSTPTREQDQGPSTHTSRATAILPLHPLLLMSFIRSSFLLICPALAMTLATYHAGSNKTTLRQVEEVKLPTVMGPLRSQSKPQFTPHQQTVERSSLFLTQMSSTAAAQAPREPRLYQAQTQPYLSGAGSR